MEEALFGYLRSGKEKKLPQGDIRTVLDFCSSANYIRRAIAADFSHRLGTVCDAVAVMLA
jgi:hypothetical protein